jgi:diaminohydroxyphosphoribosylaminopyrimidine deaminase / 5-amino-6-(5-phosphoribosylamino)uracil reductase
MRRALELAARGLYSTDPNPRVGCVVAQGESIVGEGWHQRAGEPHAEVFALREAGERARGATAYVTLEPCNHHGRTPPCVDGLLAAGVQRVVYAVQDPNPRVDGAGAARLAASGVKVEQGLFAQEAAELNEGFIHRMRVGRPFVRLKSAASIDGRVALPSGQSQWITGEAARRDAHHWRARSSAILTGRGTVLRDDPALTVRGVDTDRQPLKVILATHFDLPLDRRVLQPADQVLVVGAEGGESRALELQNRGVATLTVARVAAGVSLLAVVQSLAARQVNELLVEAGPTLAGALLAAGLVDEWLVYLAPKLLGIEGKPLAEWPSPTTLADAMQFRLVDVAQVGDDVRLRLRPGLQT